MLSMIFMLTVHRQCKDNCTLNGLHEGESLVMYSLSK